MDTETCLSSLTQGCQNKVAVVPFLWVRGLRLHSAEQVQAGVLNLYWQWGSEGEESELIQGMVIHEPRGGLYAFELLVCNIQICEASTWPDNALGPNLKLLKEWNGVYGPSGGSFAFSLLVCIIQM